MFETAEVCQEEAKKFLLSWRKQLIGAIGKDLLGLYVYGSYARGGFGPHSDLDFLGIVKPEASEVFSRVADAYSRVTATSRYAEQLEGEIVGQSQLTSAGMNGRVVIFYKGSADLMKNQYSTSVPLYSCRTYGQVLFGPPAESLIPPISESLLYNGLKQALRNIVGEKITEDTSDRRRSRIVFGIARCLASIVLQDTVTREVASSWLCTFDEQFQYVLNVAQEVRIREDLGEIVIERPRWVREVDIMVDWARSLPLIDLVGDESHSGPRPFP